MSMPSEVDMRTQKQKARDYREWVRKHPVEYEKLRHLSGQAKEQYLESLRAKEQAQAVEQWKAEVKAQYPSSRYDITFTAEGAKIYERQTRALREQPRQYGTLELEAQQAFRGVERKRAVGEWTAPLYKGVSKRRASLAEYDIPYGLETVRPVVVTSSDEVAQLVAEGKLFGAYMAGKRREEKEKPRALFAEYLKAKEIERGWYRPEGGESEYWVTPKEFEDLFGVKPSLPETAKITFMQRTKKGYELQYYTPRGPPKTITGWFERAIIGTDVPVVGGPVGGILGIGSVGFQVKTWEATVGEVEEHFLGKPTARSELMTHEELLLAHGIFATVATVKVAPKITKWFSGTSVGQTIKFSRVAKTVEAFRVKLPSFKGSRLDVWLAKKKGLYYAKTRGVSPQEVGLKPFEMVTTKGKTLPKVGFSDVKATDIYWEMIQSPRTGGIMVGKSLATTKGLQTYTFEWILKGGQLVPRFRPQRIEEVGAIRAKDWQKYWQPERGLTPFVSQQQLTRMGVHPYVGGRTTEAVSRQIADPLLIGAGIGLAKLWFKPKFQPQEWEPTLTRQREKLRTITLEKQKQKQRQAFIPMVKLRQLQRQQLRTKLLLKQKERQILTPSEWSITTLTQPQAQKQPVILGWDLQRQKQIFPPERPLLRRIAPPIRPFRVPIGGVDRSREAKGLRGLWFKKTHPIKSYQEMWQTFGGKKKRKAKSKGRRRKRRRKR